MTEKQKAKELIEKFYNKQLEILNRIPIVPIEEVELNISKESALISMNEKIEYAKTFGDVTDLDIQEFERIKVEIQNFQQ